MALLLVLPTPNPPKVNDRQLQYFADDDFERTHLDRGAPSVNAPNILPSNDSLRTNISKFPRVANNNPKKNETQPLLVTQNLNSIHS